MEVKVIAGGDRMTLADYFAQVSVIERQSAHVAGEWIENSIELDPGHFSVIWKFVVTSPDRERRARPARITHFLLATRHA